MIRKFVYITLTLVVVLAVAFFTLGPQKVDANLNPVIAHSAYPISKQAQILHDSLIVGDWHADTLLWNRDIATKHDYGHVDIPRLQAGNVGLQMFTTVTKSPSGLNYDTNSAEAADDITKLAIAQRWPLKTWSSLTERALYQAGKLHNFEEASPNNLMIIKSQKDLAHWLSKRESQPRLVGGLIGTEGSHALDGKLENIQRLYNAGFRMMSLQHFFDNKLGGSLHGISQKGLTPFGVEVIAKINELSIILDVSHSSEQTVEDALKLSKRPLVVSHTGFNGYCESPRNISDDLMKQIASKGGLIAVGYWDGAVCGNTPTEVAAAIKYGISLVGENHVALGSDFDGSVATGIDTSELAAITQALIDTGVSEEQIRKVMGENMLVFLNANLPDA